MNDDLTIRKLLDMARRADSRCCWEFSSFLDAAQQNELLSMRGSFPVPVTLYGGHERCERRIAMFGSEELCGYQASPPIVCLEILPQNEKFAQELSHRDYLGALMALGIRREAIGDIFVNGKKACVFCLDSMERYITDNLTQVARTNVFCRAADTPPVPEIRFERMNVNAASERLDAVVCAVWNLSRNSGAELIKAERIAVNARVIVNASYMLRDGDTVSCRGYGKFVYRGIGNVTRKGRYYLLVDKYI